MRSPTRLLAIVTMTLAFTGCGSPTRPTPSTTSGAAGQYNPPPAPPPQPSGILTGKYHGPAGDVLGSCNGVPYDQLDLSLQHSGDHVTGLWAISGFCGGLMGEGGTVDGTFDPTRTSDGVGTVSLNLAPSPDFGGFFIKAIVTTADGSTLSGKLLNCGPALCSDSRTLSGTLTLARVAQ